MSQSTTIARQEPRAGTASELDQRFNVAVGMSGCLDRRCGCFFRRSEGTTSVEYAVMLAMIIAAVISAIGAVGGQSGGLWANIQAQLSTAGFGS